MHCFYAFIQFQTKFPECCYYTVKAGRHFLNDVWKFYNNKNCYSYLTTASYRELFKKNLKFYKIFRFIDYISAGAIIRI